MDSPDSLKFKLASSNVPEYMHDGMILWLTEGIPPGSFLTAVLSNDLREACSRADETNRQHLYDYIFFLYNYAPSAAWGSEQNVVNWAQSHARRRSEARS